MLPQGALDTAVHNERVKHARELEQAAKAN